MTLLLPLFVQIDTSRIYNSSSACHFVRVEVNLTVFAIDASSPRSTDKHTIILL